MKHVWLVSGDAARQIVKADSAKFAAVYASKRAVLSFWKSLKDVEFITKRPDLMEIVWHRPNGENVLRVAVRREVIGS